MRITKLLLICALFLCLVASQVWGAAMTVVTVSSSNGQFGDGRTSGSVTAGNGLIIVLEWDGGTEFTSPTVSGETLLFAAGKFSGSSACCGTQATRIGYIKSLASTGTKTFQTSSSHTGFVTFIQVSGHDTTTFFDANCTGSGNSGTLSCSLTTASANELIVATFRGGNDGDYTAGSGYTITNTLTEYNADVGAAGSKTVSVTQPSNAWILQAAAFLPASTAAHRRIPRPIFFP